MPDPQAMRGLVRKHIRLWKTSTHAAWRACFSDDYEIEDPVGTGLRPMGSYLTEWDNMHGDALQLDMECYRLLVGGSEILADLRAIVHLADPPPRSGPDAKAGLRHALAYNGIYTIGEEGLIVRNRTFADPVSEDFWQAFYPTLPLPSEGAAPPLSDVQVRQAIEDHLYFWNLGSYEQWRARFSDDARVEDPAGGETRALPSQAEWDAAHRPARFVRRGCNRVVVCGMEALAHTVEAVEGTAQVAGGSSSCCEIFSLNERGEISGWRVFRDG